MLAGLGGSGKSTIALAVARDAVSADLRAWWVAVADAGSVASALLGLARKLGAPDGEVAEALAGQVNPSDVLWPCLEAAPGWVLVLDNADDPAALAAAGRRAGEAAGWLRPTRAGLVLVTSRSGDIRAWGPMARVHEIGPLGALDGGQALLDLVPGAGDAVQASVLSSRLGGLPLALHQAGTYLASPFAAQRTFEAYGQVLQDRFAELLSRGDDGRAGVTETWEIPTGHAGHAALSAGPRIAAGTGVFRCCHADPAWSAGHCRAGQMLRRCCRGRRRARRLLATGLIDIRDETGGSAPSAVLHPLVAEVTRRQAGSGLADSFGQAAGLMGAAARPSRCP